MHRELRDGVWVLDGEDVFGVGDFFRRGASILERDQALDHAEADVAAMFLDFLQGAPRRIGGFAGDDADLLEGLAWRA